MKVALVYDRVNKFGGAERVLLALHEIYPDAPLYTSVYDKKLAPWAEVFDVRTSFLQKLPLPKNKHEYYPFLMGIAFESFNFDEYDVVVSVTHEFAKAVITKPKTLHICYCLTPTSYLWSGHKAYFSSKPELFRSLTLPIVKYLRWYDKIVASRPDQYLAISKTVQDRIKKYYGLDSDLIYPPVSLGKSTTDLVPQAKPRSARFQSFASGYYFLVVSRLVPNKRVDVAVRAFNKLGWPLKIIGKGTQEARLKKLAKGNIEFLSNLTDEMLAAYYRSCRAVVVCGEEDFNIVAVEAQSFGKPVVAFGLGGVTETIIPGKTGEFFSRHNSEALVDALKWTDFRKFDPKQCIQNSQRFSKRRFETAFRRFVENRFATYVRKN